MEEPQPPGESAAQTSTRRVVRAELIIAALALLTSACASIAAMLQTREAAVQSRATIEQTQTIAKQLGASVWPYLTFERSFSPTRLSLSLINQGLGPALIRTFTVTVGGEPQTALRALLNSIDVRSGRRRVSETDVGGGSVIRPSQVLTLFTVTDPAFDEPHAQLALQRAKFSVCYCSLLKDCWSLDSDASEPRTVPACGRDTAPISF